jgi:hypothetical protein
MERIPRLAMMVSHAIGMNDGKTLVPILCMHRSGSSLTAGVLHALGMSLGPFGLMQATADNPRGYFEAVPFYELDRQVQQHAFGFADDMPEGPEPLRRFLAGRGDWPADAAMPPAWLDRGVELVETLIASAAVSGFKDPRVPLVWPFWMDVFRRLPGLRVAPVLLLRSPHEIAMSMFMRGQGLLDYGAALDVTAIHFERMAAIVESWPEPVAKIRFLPDCLADDLRQASRLIGLPWQEDVLARAFDAQCKHHEPARVEHPAQQWFDRLAGHPMIQTPDGAARLAADAAARERLLQQSFAATHAELLRTQASLATARKAALALADELTLVKSSRWWRWRDALVQVPGLSRLANQPKSTLTLEVCHAEG